MSGKIDRDKIRSWKQDDIDQEVARERAALGLSPRPHYSNEFTFPAPDVRLIRRQLNMSQSRFAHQFKISRRTLQQWEQRRSLPDQPARLLLRVIALDSDIVADAASLDAAANKSHRFEVPKEISNQLYNAVVLCERCHAALTLDLPREASRKASIRRTQNAGKSYVKQAS